MLQVAAGLRYGFYASVSILFGIVISLSGILFAIVEKVNRNSSPEVIGLSFGLIGTGMALCFVGLNLIGIRDSIARNSSFLSGVFLYALSIGGFVYLYPARWVYPEVAYVMCAYFAGTLLMLLNIFVNYFLDQVQSVTGPDGHESSNNDVFVPQARKRPMLEAFAGILLTNLLPDIHTSSEKDPEPVHENLVVRDDVFTYPHTDSLVTYVDSMPFRMEYSDSYEKGPEDTSFIEEVEVSGYSDAGTDMMEDEADQQVCGADIVATDRTLDDTFVEDPVLVEPTGEVILTDQPVENPSELPVEQSTQQFSPMPKGPYDHFLAMKKTGIEQEDTMREAAHKILMYQFGQMLDHEQGTMLGHDIEELHDMRVAAMRMRSVFTVFSDHLDMKRMKPYSGGIKETRRALGYVRDLDVFIATIREYIDSFPEGHRPELSHLVHALEIERGKSRGVMLIYLDGGKYGKFKERFARLLGKKKAWRVKSLDRNGEPIPVKVRDVLPAMIFARFATVRSYGDHVHYVDSPSPELLHELRIDVKILRYTLEFFSEVLGKGSRELVKDLKRLQDNLGDMHDSVVAAQLLTNFLNYGKWGTIDKKDHKLDEPLNEPGVVSYLEYREAQIEVLLREFPVVWEKVMSEDFSKRLADAISEIYVQ